MELNKSTLLITGGTSGIGLELAKQLLAKGAEVIITGRSKNKLDEAKTSLPNVHTLQSDVSDPNAIKQLYEEVVKQFPQLNIIINNAGIMRNLNVEDADVNVENIALEIDTNLSGTIRMVQQFLPHLKTKPSAAIINVSSGLAFIPFPLSPVYSATKAGIHSYTQILRIQLKNTNIKVFELAPPGTDTPLMDAFANNMDGASNMKVDKMVSIAIAGIAKDKLEIKPGISKVLKAMSRIAPGFFLNVMNKTIEKGKTKKI